MQDNLQKDLGIMMDYRLFAKHVENALKAFYDPLLLQANPLMGLLGLELDSGPGQLRRILREAIESLKPGPDVPFGERAWRGYRILWATYIQAKGRVVTCEELGLSQTSYYRAYREALGALASKLWSKYQTTAGAVEERFSDREDDLTAEVKSLAYRAGQQSVDLRQVLASAQQIILSLAQKQGVDLELACTHVLPPIAGDPALIRQIILNLLSEAIKISMRRKLELSIRVERNEVIFYIGGLDASRIPRHDLDCLPGWRIARSLAEAYGGLLWLSPSGAGEMSLCLVVRTQKPYTILVIDDDADTLLLYHRYLQDYGLRVARSASEMREALQANMPQCIILDLLMPREDGWDILRELKSAPHTAHIPVVVCSVLTQPELALAMGADRVLNKPINERALCQALKEVLTVHDKGS